MKLKLPFLIIILLCTGFGFQTAKAETMHFDSVASGTISGRLLRSNGRFRAYTELELVPIGAVKKSDDMRLWAISGSGGYFSFKKVPPGKYTLSINFNAKPIDTSPFITTFYPRTKIRSEAKVFEVKDGSKFNRLRFRLFPKLAQRKITGKVVWSDGKPVKNVYITVLDIEVDTLLDFRVQTNAQGFFSTKAFVGRKYGVEALLLDSAKIDAYSEPIARGFSDVFVLDAKTKPINIVLKKLKQPKSKKPKDDGIIGR